MSREHLDIISKRLEDCDVFQRGTRGPKQMPVKHQLMVLLQFFGKEGETNSSQRSTFKISEGTCEKARERVVDALVSLRDEYIKWPDEAERKEIAKRIYLKYGWPHCIGFMDGTLAELAITPQCHDKSDYNGRKYGSSLTIMVCDDDQKEIRAYLAGFPGCTHDNRVWQHMPQYQEPEKYFSPLEYQLVDTAFEPSPHTIPSFKAQEGFLHDPDDETFNTALATPRVCAEHTMGLWKGRLPWLRKIRMVINDDPESLRRILKYIDASVVLHNMLIRLGDNHPANDWNVDEIIAEISDVDEDTQIPEERVLNMPVPRGSHKGTRREQLKRFICETWVPRYNFRQNNGVGAGISFFDGDCSIGELGDELGDNFM